MFRMKSCSLFLLLGPFGMASTLLLQAQDTRTVTEPAFPPVCAALAAQLVETGNTLPAADESSFDTTRVQNALNNCTSGEAVELAADDSGNNAFLIQPISIPAGVALLVDAGVTVYGSRNPRDYDAVANECGTVASYSSGCNPLITVNASNAAIEGYGVIDGRGGQTMIGPGAPANTTWWQLASQAQTANLNQNNPRLLSVNGNNFTLYKITLQNSPNFHVSYKGAGLTMWDVKIIAPGTARNTDGIDPGPAQNVTITNSYIGDGDDNIALKPEGSATTGGTASNMSITHNHFYVGHGMSIGSQTSGGAQNILVQDLDIDGDTTNSSDTGIRIKAESSDGGLVSGVTYNQVCMQNVHDPIQFNPFYSSSTGTDFPQFQNIVLSNVTVLTAGPVLLEGYSAQYPLTLTMNNVQFTSLPAGDVTASNANIVLGPGPVNVPVTTNAANNVTVTSNVTDLSELPYTCNASNFPLLAPEFFGSATHLTAGQPLTLTSIFEPVVESPTTFLPTEPTGTVRFYDGDTSIGSVSLSGSSDLTTMTLSSVTGGSHTYTAVYSGDSNYSGMTSAPFAVTVAFLPSTTALSASAGQALPGASVTLTATVTSTAGGTPTGTVEFLDGSTQVGSAALNSGGVATLATSTLAAGPNSLTAAYEGDGDYAVSTSSAVLITIGATATSTLLTVSASTVNVSQPVQLTATVGSSNGTPSGTVTFLDGTSALATAQLNGSGVATYADSSLAGGSHSLTASYAASGNFAASTSSPVTVLVQDFTISAGTSALNIAPGGSGSTTITLNGLGGLAGTVTYGCTGLPAYISCSFSPQPASFSAGTATTTLTVAVASTLSGWILPIVPLFGFFAAGKRIRRRWAMLAVAFASIAMTALTSCGGGGSASSVSAPQAPPAGQQTATITATASTGISHTLQIVVNVQ